MFKKLILPGLVAAILTSGCTATRSYHGYVAERGELPTEAEVGVDSKRDVLSKYGEPSALSTFDDDVWFYISSRQKRQAFMRNKTVWRSVISVEFDEEDRVASVERLGLEDGIKVSNIDRVTPTRGKTLTVLQQLLGNIGRLPTDGPGGQQGPGR